MLKKYSMNFHSDKVNSRSGVTVEHKEELREHGLRVLGWKSIIEDELRHYVYKVALNTFVHSILRPRFTVQPVKPPLPS